MPSQLCADHARQVTLPKPICLCHMARLPWPHMQPPVDVPCLSFCDACAVRINHILLHLVRFPITCLQAATRPQPITSAQAAKWNTRLARHRTANRAQHGTRSLASHIPIDVSRLMDINYSLLLTTPFAEMTKCSHGVQEQCSRSLSTPQNVTKCQRKSWRRS